MQFNGAYALVSDAHSESATTRIFTIKRRPATKTLAMVTTPDDLMHFADTARCRLAFDELAGLQKRVYALGLIVPANADVPPHLIVDGTVMNVWSECPSLRKLAKAFRSHGGTLLHGASANLSGSPTLTTSRSVDETFGDALDAIFLDSQAQIDEARRRSTSIVDATGPALVLRREGNVTREELGTALATMGLGDLLVAEDLLVV